MVDPGSTLDEMPVRQDIGGIARRATLARKIKSGLRQRSIRCFLIDCGDYCDGTPFSTEYHGEADVAAMNSGRLRLRHPGQP